MISLGNRDSIKLKIGEGTADSRPRQDSFPSSSLATRCAKKILIVSSIAPFARTGDRQMVDSLRYKLREYGHHVDELLLPFSEEWSCIPGQLAAMKLLHVETYADRLIAIRTPSHILNHPNKACWFTQYHRGAFQLWNTDMLSMPTTTQGFAVRRQLIRSDNEGLASARDVFASSHVVAQRLAKLNQVSAKVLYPPLKSIQGFRCEQYGDYFLYLGRICHLKRQALAVEAMDYVKSGVNLVIAGQPDTPAAREWVRKAVSRCGNKKRITLLDRFVSEEEKQQCMANSLGCLYFPYAADSYGYASLEAAYSEKAILTINDAEGVLELVSHGRNGLVVEPSPTSLAAAMDRLYDDRPLAERLGRAARCRVDDLNISWDQVVKALVA